jgi:2-keto-3-deoxy-L-rhamnonate aldolase RhmA
MDSDRTRLEDILSHGPYDFVAVDGQHASLSEDRLVAFCGMAEDLGIPVQFRITHTRHAYLIGRYLDLGPSIIMVPQVEDEATVDEAINAFYYPQAGKRSWGGVARHGIKTRPNRLEYAAWWNDYGVLCLQLESIHAITNARKLAKPGVDMFSFGPNDLLFDTEGYPEHPFKTVDECIRHVAEQMKGSNVRLSLGVHTPEERDRYLEMGVTVLQE